MIRQERYYSAREALRSIAAELESLARSTNLEGIAIDALTSLAPASVLGVAGGEGSGKSSLVNAILGFDAVPTQEFDAGTVVPIVVQWGDVDVPAYHIVHRDNDELVRCEDAMELRRFALQAANPNNHARLARGTVRLRHPLLEAGLSLIDLPGIEGASRAIDEETRANLSTIPSVLVVVRDRVLASAKRLVADLNAKRVSVEAVVSNQDARNWRSSPDSLIAEVRGVILRELTDVGVRVSPECIFVLHVPSISGLELRPGAAVSSLSHRAEVARFRSWIVARPGVALDEACSAISRAELTLRSALRRRRMRLHDIRTGEPDAIRQVLGGARSWWDGAAEEPSLRDAIALHRSILAESLRAHGQSVDDVIARIRQTIGERETWSARTAIRVAGRLRPRFRAAAEGIEVASRAAMQEVGERLRALFASKVRDLFAEVEVQIGKLPAVEVRAEPLLSFSYPDPGITTIAEIFGNIQRVDRVLRAYRAMRDALSPSRGGPALSRYDANVERAVAAFREAFALQVEVLVRNVSGEPSRIARATARLDRTAETLAALGARLSCIERSLSCPEEDAATRV